MPEGNDKPKSLQELTGIPAGTVFGQPESATPPVPAPAQRSLGKPKLPQSLFTEERESGNAARAMQQQINAAIRYRGKLEQDARAYYGNVSVTNDELEGYMKMQHDQNVGVQKKRQEKADAQFNKQYGDAVRRNSIVGIDQYKPLIDEARLLKKKPSDVFSNLFSDGAYSDADQARLDKRGSRGVDVAPVDMDDILDKDNNVRPEYFRKLYDMTGGNQKQMSQLFADAMQGKRSEFSQRGRQSINQFEAQQTIDALHKQTLARPLYYIEQMRQGIHSGLFSTGNFIANMGVGSAYEALNQAFGDGTYSAAEEYVASQEAFNRGNPAVKASTENQNWYHWDHILSSGASMTGEFAPALFLGGEGAAFQGVERALLKAGVQGGMKGAAAKFAARAIGDSFSGRLLQNSLHMVKTAFPPVFSGYVEDGLAKGYTADQAVARAYPRALINTLALSVPGAVSRVGMRYSTLPSKILSSATEQSRMQAMMGSAAQFIKGPLTGGAAFAAGSLADSWQNYQEDIAEGRDGVNENAKFVDFMNFEQSKKEGLIPAGTTFEEYKQLPEAQQFGYGHAFKDMAEQAMFGIIWGSIEKVWHGTGVMPNMVQADYLRTAVNDPAQFNDAVDRTVRRGKLDAAKGQSMKAFVARIAPTVEAGEAMGLKHRTAVQYAVESERMKDLAREMQTLTDQGKISEVVDGNGKKIPTLTAQNKNSLEWTPEDGQQLQARINDIQSRYLESKKTVQQLSEGTYLKGRTVSGDEMVRISGRFSPGDGLREGQAAQIVANGPYRTEMMDLQRYRQDPQIQEMAAAMLLKQVSPETQTIPHPAENFAPQNQNPPVVDRNGNVIDGAKRIAYAIANGAEQLEVARPLQLAEIARLVKDETDNAQSAAPVIDNLDPAAADMLSGARAVYDNELAIARTPTEAERKAGVTNKETRAYYAAAMHLHEQGVPRDQAIDLLRRLNGGNISAAMAEAFHNDVAARAQAGEAAPVVPGMSADITAGVSPQVTDFARRMLNGETMEEAKDQEFYDDHRQEIEAEYERLATPSPAPAPEAVPETSIHHIAGEDTKDDVLAASPYWDKAKGELLPEFQFGQPGFAKVEEWLEARERDEPAPEPKAPAEDAWQKITTLAVYEMVSSSKFSEQGLNNDDVDLAIGALENALAKGRDVIPRYDQSLFAQTLPTNTFRELRNALVENPKKAIELLRQAYDRKFTNHVSGTAPKPEASASVIQTAPVSTDPVAEINARRAAKLAQKESERDSNIAQHEVDRITPREIWEWVDPVTGKGIVAPNGTGIGKEWDSYAESIGAVKTKSTSFWSGRQIDGRIQAEHAQYDYSVKRINAEHDAEISALNNSNPVSEQAKRVRDGSVRMDEISQDYTRFHGEEPLDETWISETGMQTADGRFDQPVKLWRDPADGQLYVLDGKNRLESARRMGWEYVNAEIREDLDLAAARQYAEATRSLDGREVLADGPVRFVTSDGKYFVSHNGTGLKVINRTTGKDAVGKYRSAAIEEAMSRYKFNRGLSLDSRQIAELPTAADFGYAALESSANPAEVALAWSVQEAGPQQMQGAYDAQILEHIAPILSTTNDYTRGDMEGLFDGNAGARMHWLTSDRKKGSTLSDIAHAVNESMYDGTGIAPERVTPDDILDFMKRHPAGVRGVDLERVSDSPLAQDLARKFERMTGFPLNKRAADMAMSQQRDSLSPEEQAIFDQEIRSYEHASQLYDDAVANGSIDPGAEDARNPSVEGTSPDVARTTGNAAAAAAAEQPAARQDGLATKRFGRVTVFASTEVIAQSGWTERGKSGFRALFEQMQEMFGTRMGVVITDNKNAAEYWEERGQQFEDMALVPNAWVSADLSTIHLNIEKCPPSAVMDELGHVWNGWARVNAPQIHEMGVKLAEGSAEMRYMDEYLAGETPVTPEGMSEGQADLWQRYADAYGLRENGRDLLIEEVLTHAIQNQGQMLAATADRARSVSNDGSVKKGTWGKWLESLWSAVRDAAGFRRMTTREFSRITLDEFSRAAAEEIGRGKALTRKIKEAVDADVKRNEVRRKDAKKGEEIDESLQLQVESAGRKPKIETSEEGETSSVESGVTATVMAAMEQVSPSDIYSLIESANPRFAQELLDVSSELSHFKRMTEITDDYQRRLATVLDVIADPSLIATPADKKVMGGISGGMVPKVEGRIGEVFDTLARVANGAAGEESGVTGTRLAQMMVRLSKRNTDALKLPEFGALPRESAQPKEALQPAAVKPEAPKRAPKAMNEKRKSSLQNLDELLSLPEAPIEGDERFSLPEDPEKESKRTIAAMSFVADSIEDNSVSLSEIMTDVYDQMGDRADVLYPYIKRAYLAYQAEASDVVLDRMDDPRTVRAFDFQALKQQLNASDPESSLEPNSPRAAVENGVGQEDVQPANGPEAIGSDGARGEKIGAPQQELEPASGNIVPDGDAPADGNRGDSALPDGASGAGESEAGIARGYDSRRSGWFGNEGQRPAERRAAGVVKFAQPGTKGVNSDKLALQRAAEAVPIIPTDRQNIAESLPYLEPSQHDDVAFLEKRFIKPDGYGALLANGTGTGKTFTALGAIKRMIAMGKTDGIIVVPGAEVMKEWLNSAPALGIELTPLKNKKDPGTGVSITTFANFGLNDAVFSRPHDFIVIDETHKIMGSSNNKETHAFDAARALTLHPDSAYDLAMRRDRATFNKLNDAREKIKGIDVDLISPEDRKEIEDLTAQWNDKVAQAKRLINFSQGDARPRAIFLSATPFAYRENVQWANGFLFEYPRIDRKGYYNEPNAYQAFMIQHFGYRMDHGHLTIPDANVDTDLMERNFNMWLRKQGSLSTRSLDLKADYERKFALTPNAVGTKIDEGLEFLRNGGDGKYNALFDVASKRFNYIQRSRLLEAIKAHEFIPTIQQLHALGRKVVVFFDYNEGGGFSPFRFDDVDPSAVLAIKDASGVRGIRLQDLAEMFYKERPDLAEINLDQLGSPIETLRAAFPKAAIVNGEAKNKKDRPKAIVDFNNDDMPDANLVIVQSQVDAGWSGHDKTGKFPRVLINLGQPTAPTRAIQQEGRIYRVGQSDNSNSLFLYGNTGTMWERYAFASKIAERAATAENLAMGTQARGLKRAFIEAFEESAPYTPSLNDGRGSRDADRARMEEMDEFKEAKTHYFAQQKKNARTKAMEGVDYFATPEPLGYKMVQWAQPRSGESWLEPSAGHGAIARFLPERTNRTIIEPSTDLFTKSQMNVLGARGIQDTFENLHISNKFDGIVMNPPFGTAGTTASEHVQKAVNHLRPGGRIVALVPVGMFDGKFEKWFSAVDQRGRPVHPDLHLTARIKMPASTFERAGTKVGTQILIIDRAADPRTQSTNATRNIDLSEMQDITSLFDRIEHMDMPSRPGHENATTAPAVMPVPEMGALSTPPSTPNTPAPALNTPPTPAVSGPVAAVQPAAKVKAPVKSFHTKSQKDIWVVERGRSLSDAEYAEAKQAASRHGGYWSSFKGGGAIPGFIFSTPEGAEAFHKELAATAEPASTATVPADYKLPAGATNEQKELYGRWQSAGERLVAAREKIASTRRDLDKRIMDDGANLFGERKATAGSMFDVRVDPAQRDVQLQPLQEAVTKAESELNELGQQLAESEGKASAQREMFSLPMREVVDEARLKADQGSDRAFETYMEGLGEEGQADPEALAARGELFSLPLSRRGRAKSILSVHDKYFIKEDANIGNRELAKMQAGEMARRFQEEIKSTHGEKPSGIFSRKAKAEWEAKWRDTDRAIHIYMDTLRNPAHIADFDKALADAKLKVNDPAATPLEIEKARNIMAQEKIVTLSQNLTKEQKDIADKIGIEYDKIGKLAINNGIIKDVIDNYVSRAWDFGAFSTEEANKFSTSTRHSMKRALDTILEGFTRGFKLKIEGASNNLSTLYREINNVIENQRLLEEGLNMKDEDGKPLFSTSSRRQDYQRIENKSFRKWQYVGRLSDYSSADRASFNRDTIVSPSGAVLRKMDVFAPKDIAKSLNNVLGSSQLNKVESLNSLTRFNANVKKSILSASVFHYIAFTRAHILGHSDWLKNPRFVSPRAAYRAGLELMAADHPLIQKMIQNGMTLGRMQDFTEGVAEHSSALGRKIDELGGFPATARKSLLDFNHAFHKHLFETYGAGLKAFDGIALMKKEMKKYPNEDVDVIAKRVAKVMNDSYGGVNWNMHFRGNAFQNPTVRHLSSLLLLAPDWTTSNLRLFRNAFRNNEQGDLYRKMWAKVILRGITLTAFANAALAAMDDSEEDEDWYDAMVNRYQKGWDAGHLRWTMVDITPLYHAVGGDPEKRSYFSVFGAYSDPLRMMGVSKDKAGNISISSQDFLSHKSSFITRATLESFSGENWQHKQFTTVQEMLGLDDKGEYKHDQGAHKKGDINPMTGLPYAKTQKAHRAGEAKGGKSKGSLTRYPDYGGGVSIWKNPYTIPSYMGAQMRGMLPTALQSLMAAAAGENDWAQFAAQAPGTGVVMSKDPSK